MGVKYPRTPHLPFSLGVASDDKVLRSLEHFQGFEVVVTEKMDGENTTLYPDYFHARSLDSRHHPSRDWIAQLHAQVGYQIPTGWRICGENLYAKHSIGYDNLPSYFLAFSAFDEKNVRLDWDTFQELLGDLHLSSVPVLWRGLFSEQRLKDIAKTLDLSRQEGFTVAKTAAVPFSEFATSIAKWVRPNHVQTNEHWMNQAIVANGLKSLR